MEIIGEIKQLLPLQTGTSKNGQWKKQEVIVEYGERFPKKVCIAVWGERIDESKLVVGNKCKFEVDVESREYNSRWYTDVRAISIEVLNTASSQPQGSSQPEQPQPPQDNDEEINFEGAGLPF